MQRAAALSADVVNWIYLGIEDQFKSGAMMGLNGEYIGRQFALKVERQFKLMGYDARVTSKLYTKGIIHTKAHYANSIFPWTNFSKD